MVRYFFLCVTLFGSLSIFSQLSGEELLEKAITYHDPNHNWGSFNGELQITMSMSNKEERLSHIKINIPKEYFQLTTLKNDLVITQTLDKNKCTQVLNNSTDISKEDAKTHGLTCERANMFKNYYTYLYGLPMKLKDAGTIIDPITQIKTFKGKEYLVLKVTYEKEVGDDIWYFYFNPNSYAMEVYQFFHDEEKNDGEYILLSEEEEISGIKMPKNRAWYYNKDDAYLATDVLSSSTKAQN